MMTTFMPEEHGHGGGWGMEPLPLLLQSILAVPYFGSWYTYEGIPGGAQYLTLQRLFWDASSVILLFSNPTPKTKTGTVSRRETINRKACGRIIMTGQSKQGAPARSDQIQFITLFTGRYTTLLCFLTVWENCEIVLGQISIFALFFIPFYCPGSHTEHSWRRIVPWLCPILLAPHECNIKKTSGPDHTK